MDDGNPIAHASQAPDDALDPFILYLCGRSTNVTCLLQEYLPPCSGSFGEGSKPVEYIWSSTYSPNTIRAPTTTLASMPSAGKKKRFRNFIGRSKNKLKAVFTSASASDVPTFTPHIHTDTQSLRAEPIIHKGMVPTAGSSRPSDADRKSAAMDPFDGAYETTDTSATPKPSALQTLTSTLRSLHESAVVFPPLQAALGGLVSCVERIEVSVERDTPQRDGRSGDKAELTERIAPLLVEFRKLKPYKGLLKSKWTSSAESRAAEKQRTTGKPNKMKKTYCEDIDA
ncbi:hypothetical protein AG1IA_09860 [Rhizoctonia solani AG-1 IA]|uniref:Uncharacterized protein n=1 Tax=Thanatephorus cucumeris (strain AG1-IA) TaxID=983506 RepID=L8WDT1_THACA|nr:hypothetical protein AG1IA_09860 [Rhizoctonia solani AG-1 IA]